MRYLGKSNKFANGADMNNKKIVNVAEATTVSDAAAQKDVDDRILYGPLADKPSVLAAGQVYLGW